MTATVLAAAAARSAVIASRRLDGVGPGVLHRSSVAS
jgi:hypothetical protein